MRRWNAASKAAALALLLSVGAALWLALWPGFYQGAAATPVPVAQEGTREAAETAQVQRFSRSLLQVNGLKAVPLLVFPVLLTGLGLLAALWRDVRGSKTALWANAVVLVAFTLLALFSIGFFILPSAVALVTAAALNQWSRPVPSPTATRRRGRSPR